MQMRCSDNLVDWRGLSEFEENAEEVVYRSNERSSCNGWTDEWMELRMSALHLGFM